MEGKMKLLFLASIILLIIGLFVPVAGQIGLYLLTVDFGLVLFELAREGR